MNSSVHVGGYARVAIGVAIAGVAVTAAIGLRDPSRQRIAIRVDCTREVSCAFAEARALDIWSEHRGPGLPLDLVVDGDALDELEVAGVSWDVLVPDIDEAAAAEAMRIQSGVRSASFFDEFHDYREVSEHVRGLAELAPDRAQLHGLGASLDGRTIWALRIGKGSGERMLINGTQHAREWIATMATTCIADRLVRDYDTDPTIRAFVDSTDLWVVPIVNPDGYQYSWSTNRYWRKNRRERHGVDLNRNFSVAWGGAGSSGSKGSEIYRGEYAFSEPESIALRDLAKREQIAKHIDFHAYGQLVMYPWNWTAKPAKDRDLFAAIGDRIASAIFAQHGKRYSLIAGVELYPSGGTQNDWMYGELGALSYGIELRPKGGSGFVLPPEEIRPTCDEGLAAVLALRGAK
jgi:carboxypeptidase T